MVGWGVFQKGSGGFRNGGVGFHVVGSQAFVVIEGSLAGREVIASVEL